MDDATQLQQSQQEIIEGVGNVIGIGADLAGAVLSGGGAKQAPNTQKPKSPEEQKQEPSEVKATITSDSTEPPLKTSQDPSIPSLDTAVGQSSQSKQDSSERLDTGAVLDAIDNAPGIPPHPMEDEGLRRKNEEFSEAVQQDPSQDRREWKANLAEQGVPLKDMENLEAEQAQKQGVDQAPRLRADEFQAFKAKQSNEENLGQESKQEPAASVSQPAEQKPTAQNQKQARKEVQALGQSIASEMKDVLGVQKVDLRIYQGSNTVYPPKKGAKVTPEQADKLNRMFTDPGSIKGSMRLSVRGKDKKLKTIYQVSDGKVVKDDFGLRRGIAQALPEPNPIERQNEINTRNTPLKQTPTPNQTSTPNQAPTPQPAPASQQSSKPNQEEIIAALQEKVKTYGKLNKQLKAASVPNGITSGLDQKRVTLRDKISNLSNRVTAQVANQLGKVAKAAEQGLSNVEGTAVYNSSRFLVKSFGKLQNDGSRLLNQGNRFDISLNQKELTISRKSDGKTLFAGVPGKTRFTSDSSLNERQAIKSIPLKVGKIRHEQEQKLSQRQKVGGLKR